ncbi:hypothetical protein ScPMuIL_009870 [Solemya velum]
MSGGRIDLDKPQWDLQTFTGRLRYFMSVTDPRLSMVPSHTLRESKELLRKYRNEEEPPGTSEAQIRRAQQLYLSAFHPDTGDLNNPIGRMSFQVPGGMCLIGAMISFYKSNFAVIFWQWANQSFNALVNYTNRNAASELTTGKIAAAYISATGSALTIALGLKHYLSLKSSPMMQRFVPFAAVAAANAVNIPLMRQSELTSGVTMYDENNNEITKSRYAAMKGIGLVFLCRNIMAAPSMILLPLLMQPLEKTAWMKRFKFVNAPLQVFLSGLTLVFMVPIGCALFNQRCSLDVEKLKLLDGKKYEELEERYGDNLPQTLYFNKGL